MKHWLIGLLALASFSASYAQDITAESKEKVLAGISEIIEKRAFVPNVDFSQWPTFIEKRKEAIEKAETVPNFTNEVNRALREFGFSHIRLQSPRQTQNRGRTSVIGIGISATPEDDGLRVRSVREKTPAELAGLKTGDLITSVNGAKPSSVESLQGEEGAKIKLEIKNDAGDKREVEVELKRISTVREETLVWKGEDTAVLKVFTFSAGYGRTLIEKHLKEAEKAKYLVLDLRSNGGGAVNNLNHLLSLLMPNGTEYGTFVNRTLVNRYKEAHPEETELSLEKVSNWSKDKLKTRSRTQKPFEGKIAVLINRGSGSASEIAAAALREQRGAILVGSKSAGAVLASVFGPLPEGFSLQFPISDYLTPKGMRLEGNPLVPDLEVGGNASETADPILDQAIERLKTPLPPPNIEPAADPKKDSLLALIDSAA